MNGIPEKERGRKEGKNGYKKGNVDQVYGKRRRQRKESKQEKEVEEWRWIRRRTLKSNWWEKDRRQRKESTQKKEDEEWW